MKQFVRNTILLLLALASFSVQAQTVGQRFSRSGLSYKIISLSPRKVALVHPGGGSHYSGTLVVPETVTNGGLSYTVTQIGDSAFYDCSGLRSLTLPATIDTVGFYAFKGVARADTLHIVCQGEYAPYMSEDEEGHFFWGDFYNESDLENWTNKVDVLVPCPGLVDYTLTSGWDLVVHIVGENRNAVYYDTICEGDDYTLHNYNLSHPITGYYDGRPPEGWRCSYISRLYLTVHSTKNYDVNYYYCDSDTSLHYYQGYGFDTSIAGSVTLAHNCQTTEGCDSITRLRFTRLSATESISSEVCQGSRFNFRYRDELSFTLYGQQTGIADTTILIQKIFRPTNNEHNFYQSGCSQEVNVSVFVNPVLNDTIVDTICSNQSYVWVHEGWDDFLMPDSSIDFRRTNHVQVRNTTGLYGDTLFTDKHCMNYQYLDLLVNPTSSTVLYDTICGYESLLFDGISLSDTGVYDAMYHNRFGCDSLVTLNLQVWPSYTAGLDREESVIYHSDFNNVSDLAAWTVSNTSGVNAFRVREGALRVTSSTSTNNYSTSSTSRSQASLSYNTGTFDSIEVTFPYQVKGENGYDYLDISHPGATISRISRTTGVFYYKFQNTAPNTINTLSLSWTNDRTVGENPGLVIDYVTIKGIMAAGSSNPHDHAFTSADVDLCQGQTYVLSNGSYGLSGIYYDTLATAKGGCDSIFQLNLTVHQPYDITIDTSVCEGIAVDFGAGSYTTTQIHVDSLLDVYGCDSVMRLDLTVFPKKRTVVTDTVRGDEPYVFNGRSYSVSAVDSFLFQTYHNCDSVVVLNLTIFPSVTTHVYASICQNGYYTDHGFNTNQAGVHRRLLQTVNGADSVVVLHLTVNPIYSDTTFRVLCAGQSTIFGGNPYSTTGVYVDSLHSRYGCDSVKTLSLTVYPTFDTTVYDTLRNSGSYYFHGTSCTTTGVYNKTLRSIHGCDSVVRLNLQIYRPVSTALNAEICQGESLDIDNFHGLTTSGVYVDSLKTIHRADSIVTLTLVVHPTYNDTLVESICQRTSFSFDGLSLTTSCVVTDSAQSRYMCDSVVTLRLTVHPVYESTTNDTVWGDDPYIFFGASLTQSGLYTDTLPTLQGCDSIFHLNLQIYNNAYTTFFDTICQGDTYNSHGFVLNRSGIYVDSLHTIYGADSIVTVNLHVNPVYADTLVQRICQRTAYTQFYGFVLTTTGYTTYSDHTYRGCDSIVTLHLIVDSVYERTLFDTVRGDDPYTFFGASLTQSGLYTDTLPTMQGCDSIFHLNLQIYNNAYTTFFDTICQGDTYNDNGFVLTSPGIYVDSLHTAYGADSIVTVNLHVNPVYADTLVQHICQRTAYTQFYDFVLTTTGYTTYNDHTYRGCDSIVTLHLVVDSVYETTLYDTVRGDDPYDFHGVMLSQTGLYTDTLPTIAGCDSIFHLSLKIYNTTTTRIRDTICNGQVYSQNGFVASVAGEYRDTLLTYGGADSIVVLNLWVNPFYDDTVVQHICQRTAYTDFGSHILTTTGFTTDSLHTYRMCDSVTTLHLIVDSVYEVPVFDTLRGEEDYDFLGTMLSSTGTYVDTLPTIAGCDSIIHLNLKVYRNSITRIYDTICDGQTYNKNGFVETLPGIYYDTLPNYGDADSVVILTLTVNSVYYVEVYDTTCANRPYSHHGFSYSLAGTYTDTLPTIHSCDSVVSLFLHVQPIYNDTLRAEICDNQTFSYRSHEDLADAGVYRDFMQTHAGCDSTFVLLLTVHPTYDISFVDSLLTTENYTFGTHTLYDPGYYTDSLVSQYSCDSVMRLNLIHYYLHTTRLHDTICDGDSLFFNNNYCRRDSVYTDTLLATDGMDSLVVLFLHVNPVYNDTLYDTIIFSNYYLFGEDTLRTEGLYTHYLTTTRGCDSIVNLDLYVIYVRNLDTTLCADQLPLTWMGVTFENPREKRTVVLRDTSLLWDPVSDHIMLFPIEVTVRPNPELTIIENVVENQLPHVFRGYVFYDNVERDTIILPSETDCDTTAYYTLHYFPNVFADADTTICYGQLPFVWNGVTFTAPEGVRELVQTAVLSSYTGADSTITMYVHVKQNSYMSRHDTIVENQLPYSLHGNVYFHATNIDTIVLSNAVGCDSVLYFRLHVWQNTTVQLDSTLCDYLLPLNWNGVNFNDNGTDHLCDTSYFYNYHGADSLLIMRVHVLRCSKHIFDTTLCSDQLPMRWYGRTFDVPQEMPCIIKDSLFYLTDEGADSIIILRLRVNEAFDRTLYDTTCTNHPYLFLGQSYNASTRLHADLTTTAGCDSIVTVNLTVNPVQYSMTEAVVCQGEPFSWIDGHIYYDTVFGISHTLETYLGCDSVVYLNLMSGERAEPQISSSHSYVPADKNVVHLRNVSHHAVSFQWIFPDSVSTRYDVDYEYPVDYDSVPIYLAAVSKDGCHDTASIMLYLDRDFLWTPNVFCPTCQDNNHFSVSAHGMKTVKVTIFNREGQKVHQYEGRDGYWDGTYQGKVCPQGTYTYHVEYTTEYYSNNKRQKIGTVTLIR